MVVKIMCVQLQIPYFYFYFYFLDLYLRVSVTSHVTVTNYSHTITYHKEYYRRFWNNNVIQYILYILILKQIYIF